MLKHILIMLWNQRRKYTAVIFEQMLVFIAVALSLTIVLDTVKSYNAPGRLDVDNVMQFGYMVAGGREKIAEMETAHEMMAVIRENLMKRPYVLAVSRSFDFIPYMRPSKFYYADSVSLASGQKVFAHIKAIDEAAERIFHPDIVRGRWLRDGELIDGKYPVVVSEQFAEAAGISDILGKTMSFGGGTFVVTGVVSGIKEMPLEDAPSCVIFPSEFIFPDGSISNYEEFVAKIRPGYEDEFVSDLYKEYNRVTGDESEAELMAYSLSDMEGGRMDITMVNMASAGIVALFLLIFSILGTIGINLIDIKGRLREFALRISCGAARRQIISMFLLQNMMVTGLSAIPGTVIVLSTYPLEISLPAAGTVLLLALAVSFLCAVYPAYQLLKAKPAEQLKAEV